MLFLMAAIIAAHLALMLVGAAAGAPSRVASA
jgi:hypothetical protein